jgi:hypothetical protein
MAVSQPLIVTRPEEQCLSVLIHSKPFLQMMRLGCLAAAISDIRAPRQVHHLLVATPGRLVELLAVNAVSLERVTMLTLDEADRMLELGFEPQLETISAAIRPDRQVGPLPRRATTQGPMR